MQQKQPVSITATEAKTQFGAISRRVFKDGEHFIVERDGMPVMIMLPVADYNALVQEQK